MTNRKISVFLLTMLNLATILSIKNWPFAAEFGFSSLFFILLAVLTFFIPSALVSAELATGWPQQGGVFVWVKEALGNRMGFLAVWLLWVENVVWYPTILSFIGGTIAYAIDPPLADNNLFNFFMILGVFWAVTFLNMRGLRFSGFISTFGVISGTLLPGLLIVVLGISWLFAGRPVEIPMNWDSFFPEITHPYQLVFLSGVILSFAGIEMNAVHANDVENPQRSYPLAILISVVLIVFFTSFGTLSIAMVIPQGKINLVAGGVAAIDYFLSAYNLKGFIPLISILISFGALAGLSTWIAGPSKGLLTAAQSGDLPPILRTVNKHGMPVGMLILQGLIVTVLAFVFLIMPNVNSSFWMMTAMVSQLYLLMYLLLFVSAIVLKIRFPSVPRAFKVPGGKWGMIFVSFLGILASIFCIIFGFFPPTQIDTGDVVQYELIQILGIIAFCAAPFLILYLKKPEWDK
ncbi:MAG: amino acid permease [Chlamydiae bacterium]|nr:amino acid permease [Chlamydiota bacterium]